MAHDRPFFARVETCGADALRERQHTGSAPPIAKPTNRGPASAIVYVARPPSTLETQGATVRR